VLPDALSFSFELVAEGTRAQGATLHIIETPAWARCDDCGQEFSAADPPGACSCGSYRKTLMRGAELAVRSLELEPELV
jgi:hydrogenase nickel incorporation protein HypA/HybF